MYTHVPLYRPCLFVTPFSTTVKLYVHMYISVRDSVTITCVRRKINCWQQLFQLLHWGGTAAEINISTQIDPGEKKKKLLPLLLPGLEPGTFLSRVRRSRERQTDRQRQGERERKRERSSSSSSSSSSYLFYSRIKSVFFPALRICTGRQTQHTKTQPSKIKDK